LRLGENKENPDYASLHPGYETDVLIH